MSPVLIDKERSERLGEPVPTASERLRLRREGKEHVNVCGHLTVPVESSLDPTPTREGWEPYFVSVNLRRQPQKWITYRRPSAK